MKENLNFKIVESLESDTEPEDMIDRILLARGVKNLEKYKNLPKELDSIPELEPLALFNMKEAVCALTSAISDEKVIGILVDGDADGFASASMMKMYLNKVYSADKIKILSLPFKAHGLSQSLEMIEDAQLDMLIVPDAGSNDFDYQDELSSQGVQVLVIDHHDIDDQGRAIENNKAIIVNNMLSMNADTNENLVGSGMVYEFIRELDRIYNVGIDLELALFSLGQIADMSDVSDFEIRQNVLRGYQAMKEHPFFSAFFNDYQLDEMSVHKMAFELIPKINAVTRVGTIEERLDLISALSCEWPNIVVGAERRRKNKVSGKMEKVTLDWSKYDIEIDLITKIKGRQDSLTKKSVASIDYLSSQEDGLIIAELEDSNVMSLSGLIANKIMSKHQVPVFVVHYNEEKETYSGSMRCPGEFEFRTWINETALATSQGHEQAAGISIKKENIPLMLEETHKLNMNKDFYNVDAVYDEFSTTPTDIEKVNDNLSLFGGRVEEPKFGFMGIPIEKRNINVRGSVVSFSYRGLKFIMYNGTKFSEWLMSSGFVQKFKFDIYGVPSENDWNNVVTQQIVIDDIALHQKDIVEINENDDYDF